MKLLFICISSLFFFISCSNYHPTDHPKYMVLKPIEPAVNILDNFNDFWNYWTEVVRLSENFKAFDVDSNAISKKDFIEKLTSGKYLPLRLQANSNDSAYYQLYKLNDSVNKDIASTIIDLTMVYNHLFQMEGKLLPAFHFVDLYGNIYDPENCKGKIVVLNFWFIHCASCLKEMPELNRLVEQYKGRKNVVFISLALDNAQQLKAFLAKNKFNYAVVPDMSQYIYNTIQINSFPTHIILDSNSRIAYTPEDFQELIVELKKVIALK